LVGNVEADVGAPAVLNVFETTVFKKDFPVRVYKL
jgi:hypothetical protein